MYTRAAAKSPSSGRLSTVKRAVKSPPGIPLPVGKDGLFSGSEALLSPSSMLPAGSTITLSLMFNV